MQPLPDVARCDAFWARQETDRPLVATRVGGWTSEQHYPAGLASLPNGRLTPADLAVDAFWSDYETLFAEHAASGADVPWAAFPPFPMPWLEAILGCPVFHRDGAIWAGHPLEDYGQLHDFTLEPDNPWLQQLLAFTRALVDQSAGRFPVALALMRGPADLLSALRGPQQMVYDLYDRPDDVSRGLARLAEVWIDVARAQHALIPPFAGGYAFSVINLWARQPCGWFQDDAVALWSPGFYRGHLRACEARLSRCLPVTGMHLHPSPLFLLDDLLAMPDLDVIEVNLDVNGPSVAELLPAFRRIQEHKCLAVWGEFSERDLRALRDHLSPRGLLLQVMGERTAHVCECVETLKKVWRE